MAVRSDTTQWVTGGGVLSSLYAGFGVQGANVQAAGTNGPSVLYPVLNLPADNAVEVRMEITRLPAAGIDIDEPGTFAYTGPSDYLEYRLWADGQPSTDNAQGWGPGVVRVWLFVGGAGSFNGAVQAGDAVAGGGFVGFAPVFVRVPDEFPQWSFTNRAIK